MNPMRPLLHPIYLSVLCMGAMQTSLSSLLPIFIELSDLSAMSWSWLISLGLGLYMMFAPIWGKKIDMGGPLKPLGLGFVGFTSSILLLIIALSIEPSGWMVSLLILSRVVYGISTPAVIPAAQSKMSIGRKGEALTESLVKLNAANQVGRLTGPLLVAALSAFWLGLAPLMALVFICVICLWKIPSLSTDSIDEGENSSLNLSTNYLWVNDWPIYLMALVCTLFAGYLQITIGPLIVKVWSLPAAQVSAELGWVYGLTAMLSVLTGFKFAKKILSSTYLKWLAYFFLPLFTALLFSFFETRFSYYFGIIVFGVIMAMTTPWYGTLVRQRRPKDNGKVSGYLASVHTLGYGAGVLIGGILFDVFYLSTLQVMWLFPVALAYFASKNIKHDNAVAKIPK